jgi:hypothetical protein
LAGGLAKRLPDAFPPAKGQETLVPISQVLGLLAGILVWAFRPVTHRGVLLICGTAAIFALILLPIGYRRVPDFLGASGFVAAAAPLVLVFLAFLAAGWLCGLAGVAIERIVLDALRSVGLWTD